MKKVICALMTVLLLVTMLSSCRNGGETSEFSTESEHMPQTETKSTSHRKNKPLFSDFHFVDAEGDGTKYVIRHDMVAMSGGHGGYTLSVYEKSDIWGYREIFNSDEYLERHVNMDIQTELRDGKVVFSHSATGYETEYVVGEETYPYLFNEDGSAKDNLCFAVDTFKTVEIMDADEDGAEELVMMRQYCSIGWHANYIGDCVSLWKVTEGELNLIDLYLQFMDYKDSNT